jgi:predicted metal-binding membrane protein
MYAYLLSVSPYPNSVLSAGQLAIIAVVPVLTLVAWLLLVYAADRQPRHRGAAGTTSLPRQPQADEQEREQPARKAA